MSSQHTQNKKQTKTKTTHKIFRGDFIIFNQVMVVH